MPATRSTISGRRRRRRTTASILADLLMAYLCPLRWLQWFEPCSLSFAGTLLCVCVLFFVHHQLFCVLFVCCYCCFVLFNGIFFLRSFYRRYSHAYPHTKQTAITDNTHSTGWCKWFCVHYLWIWCASKIFIHARTYYFSLSLFCPCFTHRRLQLRSYLLQRAGVVGSRL